MMISRRAMTMGAAALLLTRQTSAAKTASSSRHSHVSTGFGISTNHMAATEAANAIRLQGGSVFDMYFAALACAWVVDPANCSPFGRMQGIYSVAGETACISAATRIRPAPDSTIPTPGNIAAWFFFRSSGRLRLPARALLAPAIALAQQGFTPNAALAASVRASAAHLSEDLRAIYLDEGGMLRARVRNPALAELLRTIAESEHEDEFWRTLRSRDSGPWRPEETFDNPVEQPVVRSLDFVDGGGKAQRLLTTSALETWGTWTLLGAAVAVELRRRGELGELTRAMEAYVLATILVLDRIPFAVGSLKPKVARPSVDLDIASEARGIADRVIRLLDASVEILWRELGMTYFAGAGSHTDDANTNAFAIASGDDFLSFTTSIGPWFGSRRSWWGAALGYSYAMKSGVLFAGQTHDVTEMSPLILEAAGRPRLAIGAAGSERILGALTYLLFLRFGVGFRGDMAELMAKPRLFPKDGQIRIHRDIWPAVRAHLEHRGFALAPTDYSLERHLGIANFVERLDNRRYRSGADPSGSGGAL